MKLNSMALLNTNCNSWLFLLRTDGLYALNVVTLQLT